MNYGKLLAFTMIGLQACASVAYGAQGDWRHAAYWFFATGITLSVTI